MTQLERRIARTKSQLLKIGPMRPGSLSQQYRKPKDKTGPFWQLNCTHNMKTTTEYVRPECLTEIRTELLEYQKFRKLVERWIDDSLTLSRLKVKKCRNNDKI